MITLDEVKSYLRISFNDDDALLTMLISVADEYLKGAISPKYNSTSERAKMLSLIVVSDLYENREMSQKVSGTVRRIVEDFSLQLRLEGRIGNP